MSVGRNAVLLLRLHLEVVAKGGLQAHIVEWSNLFAARYAVRVQDSPLGELSYAVGALFEALVLLDAQFAIPFKRKEVAIGCLKAN